MILRYYRPAAVGGQTFANFGDELNRVLLPRVFPNTFDDDPTSIFFGIGSLLGYPKIKDDVLKHKIVFGTGAAMADAGQREPADKRWHFYAVRGPLTMRSYGLDKKLVITDLAVLVARYYHREGAPSFAFGYMPHIAEALNWSGLLAKLCDEIGVRYIDPREEVESIIKAIGSVDCMICEAMHGAIVADSLRVPWIPVYTTPKPHRFKWTDWCASMGLDFSPIWVGNFASLLARIGVRGKPMENLAEMLFKKLLIRAQHSRQYLSSDTCLGDKLAAYDQVIDRFKSDHRKGCFHEVR